MVKEKIQSGAITFDMMGMIMTEQEFKRQFVANFLSSYAAVNYDKNCMNGWPEPATVHPVEDAVFLANEAWYQYFAYIKEKDYAPL